GVVVGRPGREPERRGDRRPSPAALVGGATRLLTAPLGLVAVQPVHRPTEEAADLLPGGLLVALADSDSRGRRARSNWRLLGDSRGTRAIAGPIDPAGPAELGRGV